MTPRKRRIAIGCGAALALTALGVAPVWGSIFGEENGTLIQILAQIIQAKKELQDINDAARQQCDDRAFPSS